MGRLRGRPEPDGRILLAVEDGSILSAVGSSWRVFNLELKMMQFTVSDQASVPSSVRWE